MNVLEFQDISVIYQNGKTAVHNVSFTVPEHSIVAVVGESGSGKSTLIRAAMGLLSTGGSVSQGRILFEGENLLEFSKEQIRSIRGSEMAMIFQDAGDYLNPRRKIGPQYIETIRCHIQVSKKEAGQIALDMLSRLKLADPERIMRSYPFQLSGGMRQRAAIAMAMSMHPKLLLADEPTSALDVTVQAQVVQEMLKLREDMGTAIVIVTHNMGVASRMADYIAVMKNGYLREFGARDQVINAPRDEYTQQMLMAVPELEDEQIVKIR